LSCFRQPLKWCDMMSMPNVVLPSLGRWSTTSARTVSTMFVWLELRAVSGESGSERNGMTDCYWLRQNCTYFQDNNLFQAAYACSEVIDARIYGSVNKDRVINQYRSQKLPSHSCRPTTEAGTHGLSLLIIVCRYRCR